MSGWIQAAMQQNTICNLWYYKQIQARVKIQKHFFIRIASEAEDDSEAAVEEPPALSDSGLEESATEFEFSRPSPPTLTIDEDSLDGLEAIGLEDQNGGDEGVGESDETFDDTMGMFYLIYHLKCINHLKILKYFFEQFYNAITFHIQLFLDTITYKWSLTPKKLYNKTDAIFSIYGKNGINPWHFFWILT